MKRLSEFLLRHRTAVFVVFIVSTLSWLILAFGLGRWCYTNRVATMTRTAMAAATLRPTYTPTPLGTLTPYPTYTVEYMAAPEPLASPLSDEVRIALIGGGVTLGGTCFTSIVSLVGVVTTTVITLQKQRQDTELAKAKLAAEGTKSEKDTNPSE